MIVSDIYKIMQIIIISIITLIIWQSICHEKAHHQQQNPSIPHNHHGHQHDHHQNHDHSHDHQQFKGNIYDNQNQSPLPPTPQQMPQKLLDFFTSCQRQIDQWIYIPKQKLIKQIISNCGAFEQASYLFQFYSKLSKFNTTFVKEHIDLMIKQFKLNRIVPELIKCIVKQRQIENQYLQQKKKYKYMAQFLTKYPSQGKDIFAIHQNYTLIGKKTCHFFKALFEYYYLQVLNPSQTLSTQFLRALTVRSSVFQHQDIAFCIQIESVGKLSQQLEDIDINNVYIKIPDIYQSLRFLKLKQKCKDAHNKKLINNLRTALEGMDMFLIMYKQYEPFVEIAAQKLAQTQIRLLARKFADIIANPEIYREYSKQKLDSQL